MDLPPVKLLCLEQGDRPLEAHTLDFIQLACLTHYPDRSLCVFYYTSLSERSKARVPAGGPKEDFAAFVEWVLVHNDSVFTIGPVEDDFTTSPTPPLPETSPPPAKDATEVSHEPTTDRGVRHAAMEELGPRTRLEVTITLEPTSLQWSDQVCEPATPLSAEGVLVEFGYMEDCPAHTPTAMSEYELASGGYYEELKDIFSKDLIDFFWRGEP